MPGLRPRVPSTLWPAVLRGMLWPAGILAGALIAFYRLPSVSRNTIWAEDGGIFLRDAFNRGPWWTLFDPYEGYLHVLPRLVARLTVVFVPVADYAAAITFASCLILACISALVFHNARVVSTNPTIRLAFAAVPLLVSAGPLETLGNLANLHWYFFCLAPWLLIKPAESRAEGALLFFAAAVTSLTEIQTALFLPLFLVKGKNRNYWPARAGLLTGIVAQLTTTLLFPRSDTYHYKLDWMSVPAGYVLNSSGALVYGTTEQIRRLAADFGPFPFVLSLALFVAAFIIVVRHGSPLHRLLSLVLVAGSVASWSAAQILNPAPYFDYARFTTADWGTTFFLSRYTTAPSIFLLALLPLAAAALTLGKTAATGVRPAYALLGIFLALQLAYFFPSVTSRMNGPEWAAGVSTAKAQCLADPGRSTAPVGIAPKGWKGDPVQVPCRDLAR